MNINYIPYSTAFPPQYSYVPPQQNAIYRNNRFQFSSPQPLKTVQVDKKQSFLPESFKQKLDLLNEKLDKQLKISAEIGAKALTPNETKYLNQNNSKFSSIPHNLTRNGVGSSYTPDRFPHKNNRSMETYPHPQQDLSYTFVTMPRNVSPEVKSKILEEEVKRAVNNNIADSSDPHSRNNDNRNYQQNIGLLEKIQTIQETLGINIEALLDRIYEASEQSPENPLRKLNEKKKSQNATPEKNAINRGTPENYTHNKSNPNNKRADSSGENYNFNTPERPSLKMNENKQSLMKNDDHITPFDIDMQKSERTKESSFSPVTSESVEKPKKAQVVSSEENKMENERNSEKNEKNNEIKEAHQPDQNTAKIEKINESKPKEIKNLCEIRLEVNKGLEFMYNKALEEVSALKIEDEEKMGNENDTKNNEKYEEEDNDGKKNEEENNENTDNYEDIVRTNLDLLYNHVTKKK